MSNAEADAAIAAGTTEPVDTVVRTGHDLYAYEIARAAKDMGLGEQAAVIGEATASWRSAIRSRCSRMRDCLRH